MTVTKKAFAIADYHQIVGHWVTLSGVNDGEIIDVYSSLGQRPASSLGWIGGVRGIIGHLCGFQRPGVQ